MSTLKRKSRGDTPEEVYNSAKHRKSTIEARVDPTTGQRSALPGLDDHVLQYSDDGDFDYDNNMDALAYLRAVRQEATGIPNLLVAPRTPLLSTNRDIYENGVGDFRGYYEDGAYVAQSVEPEVLEEEDTQLAYFDSILRRYETLRDQLEQIPPREAIDRLGLDHPTYVERMNKTLTQWWIRKMKTLNPRPAQIACFDKGSVLRLLRLMTQGTLLKRNLGLEATMSRWVWSLLAKLPERGELSSEEIGVVRDLGKKAVLVAIGLRGQKQWEEEIGEVDGAVDGGEDGGEDEEEEGEIANEDEIALDMDDDADDEGVKAAIPLDPSGTGTHNQHARELSMQEEGKLTAESLILPIQQEAYIATESIENTDGLAETKARVLARWKEQCATGELPTTQISMIGPVQPEKAVPVVDANSNAKATVDMIITVAGEFYGQRDLLEFRGGWADIA
ncbi:hypothetical protein MBM_09834 [Drepanopeziza brunnea f. sp. 'multigermtubi' MB_m1]|uniref:Uncharacterized protein n=1 Tax=Marssonina brunnea f. sp. multigermtubi (strain MB_m1) TaxID=1072389 RepID=K1WGH1_MARBU|nr:uncharacterized protein MBM_09834 [Drepanopeziza brunnea f. sp. 'multigermtubi' MB_m1]EKD11971.1 hypothetical protein MBM_09834 [Drepanopeziza brunnea f. sp. 'multigermtubi' MB_m1]